MEENSEAEKPICTNCGKKMTKKGHFCQHCGQKVFNGRIKMSELFTRFFHNITHLDGQFVRMVWQLLIPGKVSEEYFKGRIKRYPHPVQFFFVVMFFFLLMVHKMAEQNGGGFKVTINQNAEHTETQTTTDTTIQINASELLEKYSGSLELLSLYKKLPDTLQSASAQRAIDTIARRQLGEIGAILAVDSEDSTTVDSLPVSLMSGHFVIALVDIAKMPYDKIFDTYGVSNWIDKILVKQFIKSIRDSKGLVNAIISSLTWTILVMSGFMAWLLLLFFRRRRSYYVEHYVFLLHYFSGVFLVLTLALAVQNYAVSLAKPVWTAVGFLIEAALFMAMKKFYGASFFRTAGAWFLFNFIGIFAMTLSFLLGMLIVFIIF